MGKKAKLITSRGALLVVDLPSVEFAHTDPTPQLLALPRTLITRTFSKAWGLAGLRVGYAAGPTEVIAQLEDTLYTHLARLPEDTADTLGAVLRMRLR